jgi:hypothetical protein
MCGGATREIRDKSSRFSRNGSSLRRTFEYAIPVTLARKEALK